MRLQNSKKLLSRKRVKQDAENCTQGLIEQRASTRLEVDVVGSAKAKVKM